MNVQLIDLNDLHLEQHILKKICQWGEKGAVRKFHFIPQEVM